MKQWFSLFIAFALISCTQKADEEASFIIKYGQQEVYSAEFINKLMTLGFVNYGKDFYSKIYDEKFFEKARRETLEHFLNTFFIRSLSQKYKLKVTEKELQEWIKHRAPSFDKEGLILTLKTNNLSYTDWTNLFRDQLIQHKVAEKVKSEQSKAKPRESDKDKTSKADKKNKSLLLAVLTYDNQLLAQEAYKEISSDKVKFNKALKKHQGSDQYSWLEPKQIPFYKKIKRLGVGKVSKPFETTWGFLIVRIAKKGVPKDLPHNVASGHPQLNLKGLVEAFKKDPKLKINTDLLYSLKIKK